MAELFNAVVAVLNSYGNDRISIRHVCYRLSSTGVIPKTETAFDTLGNHLANWRKQGRIPFGRFVDATRWYHGSTTFDNAAEALEDSIAGYRKNLCLPGVHIVNIDVGSCRDIQGGHWARQNAHDSLPR
jgi:hypothetical protein